MAFTPVAHSADPTWAAYRPTHYVNLANGNFEDGDAVADGWILESRWEWAEGAGAPDGDKYMRFVRPGSGEAAGDLTSAAAYRFVVGVTYRLTCSALRKGAGTAMAIRIGGAQTELIIQRKTPWQSISWAFTIPATGNYAIIVMARAMFGVPPYPIAIDNIQIERLTAPLWPVVARSTDPNWTEVVNP